jgi:hypothetical protein
MRKRFRDEDRPSSPHLPRHARKRSINLGLRQRRLAPRLVERVHQRTGQLQAEPVAEQLAHQPGQRVVPRAFRHHHTGPLERWRGPAGLQQPGRRVGDNPGAVGPPNIVTSRLEAPGRRREGIPPVPPKIDARQAWPRGFPAAPCCETTDGGLQMVSGRAPWVSSSDASDASPSGTSMSRTTIPETQPVAKARLASSSSLENHRQMRLSSVIASLTP